MAKYGRYFSNRDIRLVQHFNKELIKNIIQCICTVFKVSPNDTTSNVYGESETGKVYYPGVDTECLVEFQDSTTKFDEFGPDKQRVTTFKFNESFMREINLYPVIGDIIRWDELYFEIKNIKQEQYVGGQPGNQHSIIADTHLARLSSLNIIERSRDK